MARRVIGLDIGAYSVKLLRLESAKQTARFDIIDEIEEPLSLDEEERELIDRQKDAVLKLSQRSILEAETSAVALSANYGQMRTMKVPFVDARKIEAVLPGLLESEVPFSIDDMMVSWHRVEEGSPKMVGGQEAEGADVRVAFGKKPAIASILHMLQACGIDPRLMHLASATPFEITRELGFHAFAHKEVSPSEETGVSNKLAAFIDFGHLSTNLCIFDAKGIRYVRSFLRGGKHLTDEIAKTLEISFKDAQDLKHQKLDLSGLANDEQAKSINEIGFRHYRALADEIKRTFISVETLGLGKVLSVAFIGGAAQSPHFDNYFRENLLWQNITIVPLLDIFGRRISPSMAMAYALSFSCLQVHAKESRFNFRKDEFAWRGELDFLRSKSVPLTLWGLVLVCSLIVLWSANSLILKKENVYIENRLKTACSQILGQKNIAPAKCLAMMKEQISSTVDVGIPAVSAADIYLNTAMFLPKEQKIIFSELDVSDKKVRIAAETSSFEDVDKIAANLSKIPCLTKVETGRAQQKDSQVKFTISGDLDCSAVATKEKPKL